MTSTAVDNASHSGSAFEIGCLTLRASLRTAFLYPAVNLEGRSVCPPRWTDITNRKTN